MPASLRLWAVRLTLRPTLRRMECGSHVVLYRTARKGILILRFLHKSMLAHLHAI